MLYDSSGTLIHDVIEPEPMGVVLKNNGAYFIGTVIDLEAKTVQSLVCDRSTGDVFKTAIRSFTGELKPSCTADIVMGMYADSCYFAGGFDDWFYETDSDLTIDDLEAHFLSGLLANGADVDSSVDAISNPGSVTLKQTDGIYAESGVLYTRILDLGEGGFVGAGKIQLVGTVDAGITSISEVRTRTSDSLEDASFSDWEAVGTDGVIQSPNLRYIQIQMTLSTTDTSMTPELSAIQIYETPKAPYSKLGYARPVVLSDSGIREAVLENAYDIIVTSELNGSDYLEFSIPFKDGKRSYLDNEKKLQITKDIYRIRTVTDDKGEDGKTITSIYAEAAFYDLAYSEKKSEQTYEAETAEKPMAYALQGTGWSVGKITVSTKRSWQSTTLMSMLENEKYKGDALLQKSYTVDFLTKKRTQNKGEIQMFYVEDDHDAIISKRIWECVQLEIKRRKKYLKEHGTNSYSHRPESNPFASKIICGDCNKVFARKGWRSSTGVDRKVWQCSERYKVKGVMGCANRHVEEETLIKAYLMAWNALVENREDFMEQWTEQLQSENLLESYRAEKFIEYTDGAKPLTEMDTDFMMKTLDHIKVFEDGTLLVVFLDGTEIECKNEEE